MKINELVKLLTENAVNSFERRIVEKKKIFFRKHFSTGGKCNATNNHGNKMGIFF